MTTTEQVHHMAKAWDAGATTAASLKPGDLFVGAFGAAEDQGYRPDSPTFRCFVSGFVEALPGRVEHDSNYRIVRFI